MKSSNSRIERLKQLLELEERRSDLQQEVDSLTQQMHSLRGSLFDEAGSSAPSSAAGSPATASRGRGRPPKAQPEYRLQAAPPSTATAKMRGRKPRMKRGALKEQIFSALAAAGEAGVRVTELAKSFAIKPVNIHSWFHSALSRHPEIKKIQGGHYRLHGTAGAASSSNGNSSSASKSGQESTTSQTRRGRGRPARGQATAKPGRAASSPAKGGKPSRRGQLSSSILSELETAGSKGIHVRDLSEKVGVPYKNIYIWFATTGKKNGKIRKLGPAHYKLG